MSRISAAVQNDLKLLKLLRDEIGLQAHLFKADLKTRWDELEQEWGVLRTHLDRAESVAGSAKREAQTAAELLIESLRTGYSRVGKALKG